MSLVFYHNPMSTSSVTESVLAEIGTPHETVVLDFAAGDTKNPDYLAINPNGLVPTIVHDGTPIWEAAAITAYLGEIFGVEACLYPEPGLRRGEALKWLVWSTSTLSAAGMKLFLAHEGKDDRAAEDASKDVARALKILDKALEGRDHLLGDYTLADTHLNSFLGWFTMMGVDLGATPNVQAWNKRCDARPAIAKLYAGYQQSA